MAGKGVTCFEVESACIVKLGMEALTLLLIEHILIGSEFPWLQRIFNQKATCISRAEC